MAKDNRDQQLDQLLRGVSGLCTSKDDCTGCPFHGSECFFGEPKPATWFGGDTKPSEVKSETKTEVNPEIKEEPKPAEKKAAPVHATPELPKPSEETQGTWLVSTTQGGVFSKYVFICSKCGYRKESFLSVAPTANCPECEKNKNKD